MYPYRKLRPETLLVSNVVITMNSELDGESCSGETFAICSGTPLRVVRQHKPGRTLVRTIGGRVGYGWVYDEFVDQ